MFNQTCYYLSKIVNNSNEVERSFASLLANFERLQSRLHAEPLYFQCPDPCPGFDKSRVHGILGCLFSCKDQDKFGKAMQTAIGTGRLFNLVVDSVETAKLLLTKCSFQQRMTIIPLNGINIPKDLKKLPELERKACELASSKTGKSVWSALSLIECDHKLKPCFEFVVGTKFICEDLDTAKLIAFDPSLGGRISITLDGDMFDPAGVLMGGSSDHSQTKEDLVLTRLHKMSLIENELKVISTQLNKVSQQRAMALEQGRKQNALQRRRQELERKLALTGVADLAQAEAALNDAADHLSRTEKNLGDIMQRIERLLVSGNSVNDDKERAQQILDDLTRLLKDAQNAERRMDSVKLSIEDRRTEVETLKHNADQLERKQNEYAQGSNDLKEKLVALEKERDQQQLIMDKLNNEMAVLEDQCKTERNRYENLERSLKRLELDIKALQSQQRSVKDRLKQVNHTVDNMIKQNNWLKNVLISECAEKNADGAVPTNDNDEATAENSEAALLDLKGQKQKIARSVNVQGIHNLAEKEEEYEELLRIGGIQRS